MERLGNFLEYGFSQLLSSLWHHQSCDFPLISSSQSEQIIGKKAIWWRLEALHSGNGIFHRAGAPQCRGSFFNSRWRHCQFSEQYFAFILRATTHYFQPNKNPRTDAFGPKIESEERLPLCRCLFKCSSFFLETPRLYKVDGVFLFFSFSRHSLGGDKSCSMEKEKHNDHAVFPQRSQQKSPATLK